MSRCATPDRPEPDASEITISASPGWYADPTPASAEVATVRYWDGATWTAEVAPGSDGTPEVLADRQRVEVFALVLALLPLIGIVGGLVSSAKGRTRTGSLRILIGTLSLVTLSALPQR